MTTTTNPALSTSQMSESQIQYCTQHPQKKVKFYCQQDRDMFCSKCILKHTSQKHEVINCSPKGKQPGPALGAAFCQIPATRWEAISAPVTEFHENLPVELNS